MSRRGAGSFGFESFANAPASTYLQACDCHACEPHAFFLAAGARLRRASDGRLCAFELRDVEAPALRSLRRARAAAAEAQGAQRRLGELTRLQREKDRTAQFAALKNHTAVNAKLAVEKAARAEAAYRACVAQQSPAALAQAPTRKALGPTASLDAALPCAADRPGDGNDDKDDNDGNGNDATAAGGEAFPPKMTSPLR